MNSKISPCLWFDDQGEEAARFYVSVFKNSKITAIARYPNAGQEIHGKPAGSVMTVAFELDGVPFTALNGGPHFKLSEAVSFQIECESQDEVDYYTGKLSAVPEAEVCGWVKDKFGLSWQIVPKNLPKLLTDADPAKAERAMKAMLQMKKLDMAALQRAVEG